MWLVDSVESVMMHKLVNPKCIRESYIIITVRLLYLVLTYRQLFILHATIHTSVYERINDLPNTRISFIAGW
jgi:hypothetical protein